MTNQQIKEYILHYIQKNKTRSAIMLSGEWGTGKSHFIENELIPFLSHKEQGSHKCVCISLYGLTKVEDISRSLYFELKTGKIKTDSEVFQTSKLATKTILKGVTSFFGVDLSASEDELNKLYESIDLSDKFIIFEDVERTQIDILQLMGYVYNLVEEAGVKLLLVTNESAILQYEIIEKEETDRQTHKKVMTRYKAYTEQTQKYLSTKEKSVSDTIMYEGDFKQAIKEIITSFENEKLDSFSSDDIVNELNQIMSQMDNYNLRSFIYACQKTSDIISNLQDCDCEFLKCIFFSIVIFSLRTKSGEKLYWKDEPVFSMELGNEQYPLFKFCYKYIVIHTLDLSNIEEAKEAFHDLRVYDKKNGSYDPDVLVLANYYINYEKDILAALESIDKRLDNPEDISFYMYGEIAYYALYLKHILEMDIGNIKEKLVKNLYGRGQKMQTKALFRKTFRNAKEELQKEFEELRKDMYHALEPENVVPNFKYRPDDVDAFYNYVCQNDGIFRMNGAFATLFDISKMRTLFYECNLDQKDSIRGSFLSVYSPSNISSFLSGDKEALLQLHAGIIEDSQKDGLDRIERLQYHWFSDNLKSFLEKL